jgi:hypothetical protein
MLALKVNIIIVHSRGVVFPESFSPEGKQHPKGEQLSSVFFTDDRGNSDLDHQSAYDIDKMTMI